MKRMPMAIIIAVIVVLAAIALFFLCSLNSPATATETPDTISVVDPLFIHGLLTVTIPNYSIYYRRFVLTDSSGIVITVTAPMTLTQIDDH